MFDQAQFFRRLGNVVPHQCWLGPGQGKKRSPMVAWVTPYWSDCNALIVVLPKYDRFELISSSTRRLPLVKAVRMSYLCILRLSKWKARPLSTWDKHDYRNVSLQALTFPSVITLFLNKSVALREPSVPSFRTPSDYHA